VSLTGRGPTLADRSAVVAAIAHGVLDSELAGLLWVLTDAGVPLVVASRLPEAARELRSAFTNSSGGVLIADSLEEVLRLSGAPVGNIPDELRELGVVLVIGQVGGWARVLAAHYVRRLERDAGGHLQRRPPAILAAWDVNDNRLEHFWWAITTELADHAGMDADELERRQADRAEFLQALAAGSGHAGGGGHATHQHGPAG
jgi:hypothetical protein